MGALVLYSMNYQERELLVTRITSGYIFLYYNRKVYVYREPDIFIKSNSIERYDRKYRKAIKNGLMSAEELLPMLFEAGLWTKDEEAKLKKVSDDIDEFKIQTFKLRSKKKELAYLRSNIAAARKEQGELASKKNKLFERTAGSSASTDRLRFLLGTNLYKSDGKTRVWPGNSFWKDRGNLLDTMCGRYLLARPSDSQIRELARSDPWRSTWASRESVSNIFPVSAAALSEDQKSLVVWTRLYDNAREDSDGPGEDAIEDDDMFDGWMILRRKASEAERKTNKKLESITSNEKILNSENIFISTAEAHEEMSADDIDEIYAMNGDDGRRIINSRFRKLDRLGQVSHHDMPDVADNRKMEKNRAVGGG